jgi:hypothetical protein
MAGFSSMKAFKRVASSTNCKDISAKKCDLFRLVSLGVGFASQSRTAEFYSNPVVVPSYYRINR